MFYNKYTLSFKNKLVESQYSNILQRKLSKTMNYIIIFLMIFQIVFLIFNFRNYDEEKGFFDQFALRLSFLLLLLVFFALNLFKKTFS